jgi:hypothetical protein
MTAGPVLALGPGQPMSQNAAVEEGIQSFKDLVPQRPVLRLKLRFPAPFQVIPLLEHNAV